MINTYSNKNLLFCNILRILLIPFCIVLMGSEVASAQDKTVRVCALDARNDKALAGATVKITTSEISISNVTGQDGCTYLTGQFPVANQDEMPVHTNLSSGAPFPNPASRQVVIPVFSTLKYNVALSVFDVQGREVFAPASRQLSGNTLLFDIELNGLANGVYVYRLTDGRRVSYGKFLKHDEVRIHTDSQRRQAVVSNHDFHTNRQAVAKRALVTVVVSRDGFSAVLDEREFSNFERVTYPLFKITEDRIPLIDMYGVKYLGHFEGGLYPDQENEVPAAHLEAGMLHAATIEPLDAQGNPDSTGSIVMTSIGMSTTSSIFCGVADAMEPCKEGTFIDVLEEEDGINTRLVVIDGADPGKTADEWEDPTMRTYDRVFEEEMAPFGLSEKQVQVAWINLASSQPRRMLPDLEADAFLLEQQYGNVLRALATRYPNLKQVFFASRVYAGYATTDLNPEPYAYESGFAVKWAIEAQILQMHSEGSPIDAVVGDLNYDTVAPWAAWGPYLWADGNRARSDGLTWLPADLKEDGTHLNRAGIEKITAMLLDFFKTSRLSRCWFVEGGEACE